MDTTLGGSARSVAAALLGAAVWIGGMLIPAPAAAQLVDTSEPCNGDTAHKPHGWPGRACSLYWNPHYSVELFTVCHQAAKHCAACYECCDKQYEEKEHCECVFFPWGAGREQCLDGIEYARDHGCKQTGCLGTFLEEC